MDIDCRGLIWEGRWTALEMLWNAVVINVTNYWWFGPLLLVIMMSTRWKELARFGAYVARAFAHSQGGS